MASFFIQLNSVLDAMRVLMVTLILIIYISYILI